MGFTERGSMYESGRGRGVSSRNGAERKEARSSSRGIESCWGRKRLFRLRSVVFIP